MTDLLVVDASVALKWVVRETGSVEATVLLSRAMQGRLSLIAPEHLIGEVGNALRKRVAQRVLLADDAVVALDAVADIGMELLGGHERWLRSLRAALGWEVTTYDALYVLLAQDLGAELVTADLRLTETARARSLPVRPLLP